MRYLLDTDTCIYIAKVQPPAVTRRLAGLADGDAGMSVISFFELVFGAYKSGRPEANLVVLERLRSRIPAVPLTAAVAHEYGRLRAHLEKQGTPIGTFDLLIAAQALNLDVTLVTNNTREYARVPGLKLENWAV